MDAETGHVLFVDLVGASLLSVEEQTRRVALLLELVRTTDEFRRADAAGELMAVASGDGVALVFFRFPAAPLRCAAELTRAVAGRLSLRMGVHVGPVARIADITGQPSVLGGGINFAKRVMDCAPPGRVLLSAAAHAAVAEHEEWAGRIGPFGTACVKHGIHLELFALDAPPAPRPSAPSPAVTPGGGVPLDSDRYVVRPVDAAFGDALSRGDAIVLLKGARQMGKTSLLGRGLARARTGGSAVAVTDLQALSGDELRGPETFYRALAEGLYDQLDLAEPPGVGWSDARSAAANLERYLRRVAFAQLTGPLLWGIDEADRLFGAPYGSEVFGLFRSWHNRRTLDPAGPWSRLTLAIAYAAEAHLFISDPNQSPFNVGTRLTLADFSQAEVAELDRRCGGPLGVDDLPAFHALLGGQPYLSRRGLDALASGMTWPELAGRAADDEGPFGDSLRRMLFSVRREPELWAAVEAALDHQPIASAEVFYRLRSAGVLTGESRGDARPRCSLYESYLRRNR